jgi:hypothetical protein
VVGAEVSMVSTSACLGGCYGGSCSLPTSAVACGGTEEICCWVLAWVASRA